MFFLCVCRCYCKLGEWHEGLFGLNDSSIPQIISYYAEATKHDKMWYKAWHSFAYLNFEAVLFYKQQKSATESTVSTAGDSATKLDERDDVSSLIIFFCLSLVFRISVVLTATAVAVAVACYPKLSRHGNMLHENAMNVVTR